MSRVILALALALGVAAGCTDSKSPRCQKICDREAKCITARDDPEAKFDEAECVAACTLLERDDDGKALVDAHEACVARAKSCDEVLACE